MLTNDLKLFAPKALKIIKTSKNILLHLHVGADPDSVSSALALKQALNQIGKSVSIMAGDTGVPDFVEYLPGAKEKFLEKNFFQINWKDFDLFIILDSGSPQLISKKGEILFPTELKTIVIDHHISNTGYGQENFVNPDYSSTSEILHDLFVLWKIKVTPVMAGLMIVGIYLDTGGFRFGTINYSQALSTASKLAKIYPEYTKTISNILNNMTPQAIYLQGVALSNITTHFDNCVAISSISIEEFKKINATSADLKKTTISNQLISVTEWEIGVRLVESENGNVDASLRSKDADKYDVNRIAKILGGGGWSSAAGASIEGNIVHAKKLILKAIQKAYPNLKNK